MFDFLAKFFGRTSSGATAKERLRLVLLSDHLSLAPDVVESLKHDLIELISRYVEVDVPNCDVTFEHRENEVAMLANIPILSMNNRPTPIPPAPPAAPPPPPERAPEPPPTPYEPVSATVVPVDTIPQPAPVAAAPQSAPAAPEPAPMAVPNRAPASAAETSSAPAPTAKAQHSRAAANGKVNRRRRRKAASGAINGEAAKAG